MKITHIITGLKRGGAEKVLYELLKKSNSNINFEVISLSRRGVYSEKIESLGIKTYHIILKHNIFSFIYNLIIICKIIQKSKPDIVQTWMYHADLIGGISAKLLGVKKIFWTIVAANLDIKLIGRRTFYVAKICGLLSNLIPTKIITVAKSSIKVHEKIFYKKNKFLHIPIGFEKKELKKENEKKLQQIFKKLKLDNKFIIANVARWDIHKNQQLLLEAISKLKKKELNIFCLLVGSNINYHNKELIKITDGFNLNKENFLLLDHVYDINYLMQEIDLFVLSSLGEGMPNVIGEAMINGTPCVSSDVGDCSYVIGNTGWVFESNNIEQLTHSIVSAYKIRNDKKEWQNKKNDCFIRISNNFSIKKMIDAYEILWSK